MTDDEKDGLIGTAMAAISLSQVALSEVMKLDSGRRADIVKTLQAFIQINKRGEPAHKVAAQLTQSWLDMMGGTVRKPPTTDSN